MVNIDNFRILKKQQYWVVLSESVQEGNAARS